jgi:methionyl aminopeptidase
MDDEEKGDFLQAGKVASAVREESKKLVMVDTSLLDIAETTEQMIQEAGAECAFPTNISVNSLAAHFTPETGCERMLGENDVVKIDLGTMINGAIADTAYTIDLSGKNGPLLEASHAALEKALELCTPGRRVQEISAAIEHEIKSRGFLPISNLTGHMIKKGFLHAGVDVPNVKTAHPYVMKEGDVFAIEPFASTGSGTVQDTSQVEIFSLIQTKSLRMREARKIQDYVFRKRMMMPFAQRWLDSAGFPRVLVDMALKEMMAQKVIASYPVLKDSGDGLVSQHEHTVIVSEKPIVTTR